MKLIFSGITPLGSSSFVVLTMSAYGSSASLPGEFNS
jgi:hypothetical protein